MVKYANTLIEQGLVVDSVMLHLCLAACDPVRCSATHQQRNAA